MQAHRIGVDDAFGHWFAGFTDGEGCFCITSNGTATRQVCCSFSIALRADDKPLLAEIQRSLGVGQLYDSPGRLSTKPYARWTVQSKPGCVTVVDLFSRFPLRGKKAKDFEIWKEAVGVWQTTRRGINGAAVYEQMRELKFAMQAGRAFVEDDQPLFVPSFDRPARLFAA